MKKYLSILLSFMLIVSMSVPSVFAAEEICEAQAVAGSCVDNNVADEKEDAQEVNNAADVADCDDLEDYIVAYDNNGDEMDFEKVDKDSYDGFIVVLKDGTTKKEIKSIESKISSIDDETVCKEIFSDEMYKADSLETIDEVIEPSNIDFIEPDYKRYSCVYSTNDTYYSNNEWAYTMMNVQSVWKKGITGSGKNGNDKPTVAVFDTGVAGASTSYYPRHEDLNYNNIPYVTTLKSYGHYYDDKGHGTFVIGEIAATMNNGKGVAGVMPDTEIISAKALDSKGSGYTSSIISLINFTLQEYPYIDVLNFSLGSNDYSSSENQAMQSAISKGMIVVAAAGNDGDDVNKATLYSYPASYSGVISVASVGKSGTRSYFSQYNNAVDVAAPGEKIKGLYYGSRNGYSEASGTSMSTPLVTGLAAMAKSLDSSITASEFMDILKKTSKDVSPAGYDNETGYGIVDFGAVYTEITGLSTKNEIYSAELTSTEFAYTGKEIRPDVKVKDKEGVKLTKDVDYSLTYSNNIEIGTANIVIKGIGEYTGEIKKTFKIKPAQIVDVEVSTTDFVYSGGENTPDFTAVANNGKTLVEGVDYTYEYVNNIDVGEGYVKVVGINKYTGEKKGYFNINPLGTTIKTPTAGKKSFTAKWTKQSKKMSNSNITGYQLQYSTSSKFSSSKKVNVKKYSTTSKTISNLKAKKKYYVRVRTYMTVSGTTYYSAWSGAKTVTTK